MMMDLDAGPGSWYNKSSFFHSDLKVAGCGRATVVDSATIEENHGEGGIRGRDEPWMAHMLKRMMGGFAMKLKRGLLFLLVAAMVMGVALSATGAEKTKVTYMTWWLSAFKDYLVRMEKEYEEKHPEIDIVWDNVDGDINQVLPTRIASGDAPDLVNLNNETAINYFQQGALEPLDPYLTPKDIEVYVPSLWNKTKFDGKYGYTFPWYASPQVMFIGNYLFKKAGLDPVKNAPKTWEDMYTVSKLIKQKTGVYGFNMEFANIAWEEPLRCGVPVFKDDLSAVAFNVPKFAARLEYFRKLVKEGLIPPQLPDYQTSRAMFGDGQLAMYPLGVSMYRWIRAEAPDLDFSVAPYPVSPNGANKLHVSMMNFVLMKSSKVKKEAAEFAKFMTGTYAQVEFAKGVASIVPSTRVSLETDPYFVKGANTNMKLRAQLLAAQTMKNADNLIVTKVPKNVQGIYDVMRDQFLAAIRGEKTVQAALDAAEKQANEMIKAGM